MRRHETTGAESTYEEMRASLDNLRDLVNQAEAMGHTVAFAGILITISEGNTPDTYTVHAAGEIGDVLGPCSPDSQRQVAREQLAKQARIWFSL